MIRVLRSFLEQPKHRSIQDRLEFMAITPGLLYILFVDLAAVTKYEGWLQPVIRPWGMVLAVTPWVTILVLRQSSFKLGYTRRRLLAEFGWGLLAGCIWCGLGMGFNYWMLGEWAQVGWGIGNWIGVVFWIPFVEETFFRGYLGLTFITKLGRWPGNIAQALLFTLHPGHWLQGWPHLVSIFGFGLLAGWLIDRRGTIWAAWGAHVSGNALPQILRLFV